ncbi:MAG TPA: LuxR C-terminal-related transcriptional regulator [Acidimicrobiales bacterium]|nr:LuxR C-terminal-related transcriptional regulator [Acidimicrobiales bacterium]
MEGAGRQAGLDLWPLVGRGDEVALATQALRRRRAVVLAGAAGVGKTRLARAALAHAEAGGSTTRWVAATRSAGTVPLGAFAHLVPSGLGPAYEGQDARAATLGAIVRAIEQQATGPGTVIGVDDAHLLDDASATLVHQLACGGAAHVVATVRSGEPTPDPIVALWKDDLALRIEVQPLSRIEVAQLLEQTLGGTVDGATARRLFDVTRGNVLFLRELVAAGRSSDALVERAGVWCWDGPLRPGVPLRELIADRLGALDESERDALELLAVGEPLTATVLGRLVSGDVLRRLERRQLVESSAVESPGTAPRAGARAGTGTRIEVRLGHPLFGEVLVDGMSPLRLDDCRRQMATAWEQEPSLPPDEILRVATWRAEVGDHGNPRLLLAGAHRALVLGDLPAGERLARSAHVAAPTVASADLLGEALHALGRRDEAIAVVQAAQELPGTPAEHAHLATGLADALAWGLGRPDEARRVLREAAAKLPQSEAQDQLVSHEALLASMEAPTTSRALEIAHRELERPDLLPASRLRAQLAAATAWVETGQTHQAIQTGQVAVGLALRQEAPGLALYHAMTLTQALVLAGRLPDAESLVETGHEMALSSHADVARGAWCQLRGVIAVFRGRPRTAAAALREADLLLGRFDYGLRRGVLVWLAMAEAMAGRPDAAEQALADAQRATRSRARLYDADWVRARGWAQAAAGQRTKARQSIREAVDIAVAAERWTSEVLALHDLGRLGGVGLGGVAAAAPVVARLDELGGIVDGPLAPACAAHARALAAADGDGLDAAAATFTELGLDLFAAEAQVSAVEAHRRGGHRARAHASAERARRLTEGGEGASTPLLQGMSSSGLLDELTPRERETAELAARGLTDREIADALFLSIRTVHAHLRSAYAKLGVAGRGELAAILAVPPAT